MIVKMFSAIALTFLSTLSFAIVPIINRRNQYATRLRGADVMFFPALQGFARRLLSAEK